MAEVKTKGALKGFRGAKIWPVVSNTEEEYKTGVQIPLSAAQNLGKEETREEYTIYADDGIYDTGSEYKYENLTFTIAELPLKIEAELKGSNYDKTYILMITDWLAILSGIGVIISIIVSLSSLKAKNILRVEEIADMRSNIKHIREKVDKIDDINKRVVAVKESAKQAHKRIDEMKKGA